MDKFYLEALKKAINDIERGRTSSIGVVKEILTKLEESESSREQEIIKQKERAIHESETRYRELFENMSSGVAVYEALDNGSDFIVKDFNRAGELIEGIKKEDIIGRRFSQVIDFSRNKEIVEALREVYRTGISRQFLFTYIDSEGIKGWRENFAYKLNGGEIVVIFDDISERKAYEKAMQESEERYRSFLQHFKGIAYRLTSDGKVVFMHGLSEELTGYSSEDFISGKVNYISLVHPADAKIRQINADKIGVSPGFEYEYEYRIQRRDGEIVWVNEYLKNIADDLGRVIYVQGTIYNIDERKKAEMELKTSRELLRNLAKHIESAREEERKTIAIEIHDELGHALTTLKLELNLLLKKKFLREDILEKRIADMSKFIEGTIKKLRAIVTQLRPSVLDHFGLIAALEWQAKEFQKQTGIRCNIALPDHDIDLEEHKSIALFRITQELLTNVAKHAQASRVDISLKESPNELELKVSDNGVGMKSTKPENPKSFGLLGMQERADFLGGTFKINSIVGIGTTVTVNVPN